jgi:hypothetical protein
MGNNINDETRSFAELISNIRFNGIAWNVFPDEPQLTGEASIQQGPRKSVHIQNHEVII